MLTLTVEIMNIKSSHKSGDVLIDIKPSDTVEAVRSVALALASDSLVKLKTVLVPVDFSECSKQALAAAVPFARQFGAKLELVHVVASYYAFDPNGLNNYQELESACVEAARKALFELVRYVVPRELAAHVQVRCGRVVTEITDAARECSADLIIISTHGYTGLKHVAFGSTAEGVVRHAPCPVLTVRAKVDESNPE